MTLSVSLASIRVAHHGCRRSLPLNQSDGNSKHVLLRWLLLEGVLAALNQLASCFYHVTISHFELKGYIQLRPSYKRAG